MSGIQITARSKIECQSESLKPTLRRFFFAKPPNLAISLNLALDSRFALLAPPLEPMRLYQADTSAGIFMSHTLHDSSMLCK